MHRRSLTVLVCSLTACLSGQESRPGAVAATKAVPRDALAVSADQQRAIESVRAQLEAKAVTVAQLLADPALVDLHDKTAFRELVRAHADSAPVTMVAATEPGVRLT